MRLKNTISWVLVVCCLQLFAAPIPQAEAAAVSISASSAVLIDPVSNRILYSKTPYVTRAPASTTKLLTAMVVMDSLSLDKVVTIPKFAESIEPSKAYLRGGERYYVRDLLRATLISSANDAAEVLAVAAAGSRAKFAEKMNRKARAIGAKKSRFVRASGLPAKGQRTTAYDMALIVKSAQKYPFIVRTLRERTRTIRSLNGRRIPLRNHNKMLWKDSREVVGKTGWTRKARHCFVGHLRVYKKKVVIAILGSRSLWRDIRRLLDYQFGSSYHKIKINQKLWSTRETRSIQTALKRAGFNPGPADGKFGPQTLQATKKFQRSKRLKVDGIVGTLTWKKLKAYL